MNLIRYSFLPLLGLAVGLSAVSGAPFELSHSVIGGGGGSSGGGTSLRMDATVGQAAAATNLSGGTFSMRVGFWQVILPTLEIVSIARAANGHVILQCFGVPNEINNLRGSPDLSPGSFMTLIPAPAAADGIGSFQYDDAGAVGLTKRFYRLTYP